MKILALEFSTDHRSVACGEGAQVLGVAETIAGRTTPAFGLITTTLAAAHWEREAIEAIAVGLGPGSYTGIRSAVALAQGWQAALGTKLIGISTAAVLAAQAQTLGWHGRVQIVIDAQRNEFYAAEYLISKDACAVIQPLKLATIAEVEAAHADLIIGPDAGRWFESARSLFPTAAMLARLAAESTEFISGEKLEPIYLRETTFVKAPPLRKLPN